MPILLGDLLSRDRCSTWLPDRGRWKDAKHAAATLLFHMIFSSIPKTHITYNQIIESGRNTVCNKSKIAY